MAEAALDITLNLESQNRNITLTVDRRPKNITIEVEKGSQAPPVYEGPYTVGPRLYVGRILDTMGKTMEDYVEVLPIPVSVVSNPYGGKTVVIG